MRLFATCGDRVTTCVLMLGTYLIVGVCTDAALNKVNHEDIAIV
jgi:hypothetical protein